MNKEGIPNSEIQEGLAAALCCAMTCGACNLLPAAPSSLEIAQEENNMDRGVIEDSKVLNLALQVGVCQSCCCILVNELVAWIIVTAGGVMPQHNFQ